MTWWARHNPWRLRINSTPDGEAFLADVNDSLREAQRLVDSGATEEEIRQHSEAAQQALRDRWLAEDDK